MMNIRFLGACQEVGRSGVAVKTNGKHILLDYGVVLDHEIGFPVHVSPNDLEGIVLSHAHLDHSGLLPLFFIRSRVPLYSVEPTFGLTEILIRDMIKLSGYYLPFEYIDLKTMLEHAVEIPYREEFRIGATKVKMLHAGHIPGSAQILLEADGKRLLYTGDMNLTQTRLVPPADTEYGDVDAVITESTYAMADHSDRESTEDEFVHACTEVVEAGGTVLVPAFGVGRSQEVMCMLAARGFKHKVFVDGMALDVIRIFQNAPHCLGDPELFKKAVRETEWIRNWADRRRAVKTPAVIVSPAGMLKGGAAVFYMDSIASEQRNAIFLVSFQVPGSPGRVLLDEGKFMVQGRMRKVAAKVAKFDFSSHGGMSQLHQTLSSVNHNAKVFVVHGELESCMGLANWASKELGMEAYAPKPGDSYDI